MPIYEAKIHHYIKEFGTDKNPDFVLFSDGSEWYKKPDDILGFHSFLHKTGLHCVDGFVFGDELNALPDPYGYFAKNRDLVRAYNAS